MQPHAPYVHLFRSPADEAQARKYLPRLADASLSPSITGWGMGSVSMVKGTPALDWLAKADDLAIGAMRIQVLDLIRGMHTLGVCHRDLHVENIVIVDGQALAIDVDHACDVDPSWPCYDLTGPSPQVPLLPAHAQWGGVLGSTGMWWGASQDTRWNGRYVPLGRVFGPL